MFRSSAAACWKQLLTLQQVLCVTPDAAAAAVTASSDRWQQHQVVVWHFKAKKRFGQRQLLSTQQGGRKHCVIPWLSQIKVYSLGAATDLIDVQGNDVSANFRLGCNHGRLLHLLPVGPQVGQPQVVVHKLEADARNKPEGWQRRQSKRVDDVSTTHPFHAHRSNTTKPLSS